MTTTDSLSSRLQMEMELVARWAFWSCAGSGQVVPHIRDHANGSLDELPGPTAVLIECERQLLVELLESLWGVVNFGKSMQRPFVWFSSDHFDNRQRSDLDRWISLIGREVGNPGSSGRAFCHVRGLDLTRASMQHRSVLLTHDSIPSVCAHTHGMSDGSW